MNRLHLRLRDRNGEVDGYLHIDNGQVRIKHQGHEYDDVCPSFDLGIEIDEHVFYDGDKVTASNSHETLTGNIVYNQYYLSWMFRRKDGVEIFLHKLRILEYTLISEERS